MKKLSLLLVLIIFAGIAIAKSWDKGFESINNYHAVSENLASSGMLELEEYQKIKAHGFQHVVNLVPGNQIKERKYVESLDMTYEQIPVDWGNPKMSDFETFVDLMKSYGDDMVYVHCELNWRASAFVYLYRITQLGVSIDEALEDLTAIWKPKDGWQEFIDAISAAYLS
jgi:protein tyrosine phosphatase (PTP) superfamily phosphohydrolase (DUF442 family)